MFNDFIYVLAEQDYRSFRTDTVLLFSCWDRAEIEELVLTMYQDYEYYIFCKYYNLGEYPLDYSVDYAISCGKNYGDSLFIVKVPLW